MNFFRQPLPRQAKPKLSMPNKKCSCLPRSCRSGPCVNRNLMKECIDATCSHGSDDRSCGNRFFHNFNDVIQSANVYIHESTLPAVGQGLFANRRFVKHDFILPYNGVEIMLADVNKILDEAVTKHDNSHKYIMWVHGERYINGISGVAGRINHSHQPNCTAERVKVGKKTVILIQAKRAIDKGEELFFDYSMEDCGRGVQNPKCRCSSDCKRNLYNQNRNQQQNVAKQPSSAVERVKPNDMQLLSLVPQNELSHSLNFDTDSEEIQFIRQVDPQEIQFIGQFHRQRPV